MHWIFLEYDISIRELFFDLASVFPSETFYLIQNSDNEDLNIQADSIPISIYQNNSLFKKQIEFSFNNEIKGLDLMARLARYLSQKYSCDAVTELGEKLADEIFGNHYFNSSCSLLYRQGQRFIISDIGIEKEGFQVEIIQKV